MRRSWIFEDYEVHLIIIPRCAGLQGFVQWRERQHWRNERMRFPWREQKAWRGQRTRSGNDIRNVRWMDLRRCYNCGEPGLLRAQCARSGRRSRRTRTSRRVQMRRSELAGENTAGQREEPYGSLEEQVESRMEEQRVASVQTTRDRRSDVGEEESAKGREVNGEQEQLALEQMRGAVVETVQDPDEAMAWEELMRLGEIGVGERNGMTMEDWELEHLLEFILSEDEDDGDSGFM
ncbi:unnamed protein product [Gordionus sp. m RMFG-2023]